MIVDALLSAERHLRIAEQVFKPDKFVYLTEDIMSTIERSTDDVSTYVMLHVRETDRIPLQELSEARGIIDRIRKRDLYRMVDCKIFSWEIGKTCQEYITPASIVRAAKGLLSEFVGSERDLVDSLSENDVIVDVADMHYGMKDKNPMDSVKFYSKHNPNRECLASSD